MEWNIDVHKFLSETTRTALKVIVDFGVTSASDNELITKAEHKMAELGVYKSKDAAEGRVRRALFTYFKNYNLMYDDTTLTPIGKIFQDNRISIKEFAFYYLVNYKHQVSKDKRYYPLQLIIKCLKEKQSHSFAEEIITSYDFSRLVLCESIDDIDDSFIEDLKSNSDVILDDADRRRVGFDVWQNLLCSAGLFVKGYNYSMIPYNNELIDWIYNAYSKKHPSEEGEIITGVLQELPLLNIDRQSISTHSNIWGETNALQAYLFDSVDDAIISKYIYKSDVSTFNGCWNSLGISQYRGAFKLFSGFERLVGYRLYNSTDVKVKNIGRILINSSAPKTPSDSPLANEPDIAELLLNSTENKTTNILISDRTLSSFILRCVKKLNDIDGLNSLIPYITSPIREGQPIKIASAEGGFSLTGMFLETSEEDRIARNEKLNRWFPDVFTLDEHQVYLSTQWNGKGDYQLTKADFVKMLEICYPNRFSCIVDEVPHTLRVACYHLQEIYYGSPGTGKSHTVEKFVKEIKEKNPSITDYRTTFHPDYDYASFVGSYKPVVKQDSLHKGKKYTEDELAAIYVKNVVPAENSSIGFVEQRIKFGVDYCEYFNGDIAEYDINHILELAGKEVEAGSKNRVGFTYVQYGVKIGPDTRRLVNESTITYEFVPQVFTKAYVDAWNKLEEGTPVYLVIEEINRGNCAQIFGDIFQLLDRKDDGYSKYPVVPDTDLKDYLTGLENWGKTHPGIANGLCLPPNLNIIATMNTSDQSLFPMDSAFKRRWDWKFIPIDPDCPDSQFKITIGEKHFSWASFITKVNQRILKLTESEDKQIGNFFIKKDIDADEFRSKVMFYLWNDVCKEHYNAGSFFKYTSGEDVEKEFTFNQLFAGDVTNILQGFMAYLEVEEK